MPPGGGGLEGGGAPTILQAPCSGVVVAAGGIQAGGVGETVGWVPAGGGAGVLQDAPHPLRCPRWAGGHAAGIAGFPLRQAHAAYGSSQPVLTAAFADAISAPVPARHASEPQTHLSVMGHARQAYEEMLW